MNFLSNAPIFSGKKVKCIKLSKQEPAESTESSIFGTLSNF